MAGAFAAVVLATSSSVVAVDSPAQAVPTFTGAASAPAHQLSLWYRQPATNWMTSALPIGNGRLGAMVFGGVENEHLQFNESSLWTGSETSLGNYQNFGDLYIDVPSAASATVNNYRRELDLEDGVARVQYQIGTATYNREYFSSFPDNVLVGRFTSTEANKISLTVRVDDAHVGTKVVSGNSITLRGTLTILGYEAQVLVKNEGGTMTSNGTSITVNAANAVTILLAAGTDFDPAIANYKGANPTTKVSNWIGAASSKTFATLLNNHLTDYRALFSRVSLNLNDTKPTVPTDQLIQNYNSGDKNPALEKLHFQYGRYLTIASSRNFLPSNLQGIWNNSNTPPWQSDYHTDINLQMNYWPTDITNLSESFAPLSDFMYQQAMVNNVWSDRATAEGNGGISMATQMNPFGYSNWENNPEGIAWLLLNLWDHYQFTQDQTYLSTRLYPIMKEACDYWLTELITDTDGKLVAPQGWSPEHGNPYRERGTAYSQQLIWMLFDNTIQASSTLGVDSSYRSNLQTKLSQLDPGLRVGSFGQLREWKYQQDVQGDQHRHLSHLVGLYPGDTISPYLNPTMSNAARVALDSRSDTGTGWSTAWKINARARLLDAERAKSLIEQALRLTTTTTIDTSGATGGVYANLLDAHPPFQIDGNFGFTSGVAELLLQSQRNNIHLLPALPGAWSQGSFTGLKARGNFTVDASWANGNLTSAVIKSVSGLPAAVQNIALSSGSYTVTNVATGAAVANTRSGDTVTFATTAGASYRLTVTAPETAPVSGMTYNIITRHSNMAVDVKGASTADGAAVIQWPVDTSANKRWKLTSTSSGYYKLEVQHSNKSLSVSGESSANGATIIQSPYSADTTYNDEWRLVDMGGGYYQLVNRLSGKALDMPGATTTAGKQFIQYTAGSGTNQQFKFVLVP